jgi:hypothetical protein
MKTCIKLSCILTNRRAYDFRLHCKVDEICALLGYYAVYMGNSLPTFQNPINAVYSPRRVQISKLICTLHCAVTTD